MGDLLYGGNRFRNLHESVILAAVQELRRNFLHAHRLSFTHPRTGKVVSFTSPLPPDLEAFLARIA